MKAARFLLVLAFFLSVSTAVHAEWHFGLGTGLFLQNVDGDEGFDTDLFGPIIIHEDLSPEDFSDATESAIGFGGFASNGTWVIRYSAGMLKLEGGGSQRVQGGAGKLSAQLNYDITFGELIAGYPIYSKGKFTLRAEAGLRYTRHDITFAATSRISPNPPVSKNRNIDESWTDVVVGLSTTVALAKKWSWDSLLNAGFGGSEGSYTVQTGIGWHFAKHWATSLYGKFASVEYENGTPGDSDWYLYDADEFGVGLSVLVTW